MEKILTIAIPTYNRCCKLKVLLDFLYDEVNLLSIDQRKCVEIYIFDNCSPDETHNSVIQSNLYMSQDVDCYYIKNERNVGLLGNFKNIYNLNAGEYLWVLGDDDTYYAGILESVYQECRSKTFSYIFINHKTVCQGKTMQESVLGKIDSNRNDRKALLDLYFQSETVMMFISACVYKTQFVHDYIKKNEINLVSPCSLSFFCASKGLTKYIENVLIENDWTDASWKTPSAGRKIYYVDIPVLFLKLPNYGYERIRCYKNALRLWKNLFVAKIRSLIINQK